MADITNYLLWTRKTWQKPDRDLVLSYAEDIHAVLGLVGEAGEVSELIKKAVFTPARTVVDEAFINELKKELGDVLYYWARLCDQFGIDPDDIVEENIRKLEARYGTKDRL